MASASNSSLRAIADSKYSEVVRMIQQMANHKCMQHLYLSLC